MNPKHPLKELDDAVSEAGGFDAFFKSEIQIRAEAEAERQDRLKIMKRKWLEIIQPLPEDAKRRLATKDGQAWVEACLRRTIKATEEQQTAVLRLIGKALRMGKTSIEAFLKATECLSCSRKSGETPDRSILRDFDAGLFAFLRCTETREQLVKHIPSRVEIACRNNDIAFISRLGRALAQKPSSMRTFASDMKLEWFLCCNWHKTDSWAPAVPLSFFCDRALLEFCSINLKLNNLSLDALSKCRVRLELRQERKPLIAGVRYEKGEIRLTRSGHKPVRAVVRSK